MQQTGKLSIDDNRKESRLDDRLLAVRGAPEPLKRATDFLQNLGFADDDEARITGSEGKIGQTEVIFMTNAERVGVTVPAMAAPQIGGLAEQTLEASIVPPRPIIPPKGPVPPKQSPPSTWPLPPKSWVLSESGEEFVEEVNKGAQKRTREAKPTKAAKPAKARKRDKKAAAKKKPGSKAAKKVKAASPKKAAKKKASGRRR